MEKPKPTIEELVTRVDVLAEAVERMLRALKEDLVSLRDELQRLEATPRDGNPTPIVPPPSEPVRRASASLPKGVIAEERAALNAKSKRDPRMDD